MTATERSIVLVVDDDATLLNMTARYLRAKGLQVLTTSSPLGVGALVMRHRPAVIVLDIAMPALDGEALARLLRGQGAMHGVPIVVHSALSEERLAAAAMRCKAAAFVQKGAGLAPLHSALLAALNA